MTEPIVEETFRPQPNSKIKRLTPELLEESITKIRKDSDFVVLTPRIFKIYQKHGKTKCVSCNLDLKVFDTVYNSSTRKPYHIMCALTKNLIKLSS
jgi:hypothetical protein